MVLRKEYRICMPLTTDEYKIGQLYMISRHSAEQSGINNEGGVEVIVNEECFDATHGSGQFTEKHIHLSSRLPYWLQAVLPKVFYITEKAWNYYPFTITEYTCSFIPRFQIIIHTRYADDNGTIENCLNLSPEQLRERIVDHIDIAYDELSSKHYKVEEDVRYFQSVKTKRGPLAEGWRTAIHPIMCSYKLVEATFDVFGLQGRVEDYIQSCIREILLLGHRQAFAWIDNWIEMTLEDVRQYETDLQRSTNAKIKIVEPSIIVDDAVKENTSSSVGNSGFFSWL